MTPVSDSQPTSEQASQERASTTWLRRLRGLVMVVLGYLLSPLSWWNDLFFNLPVAYGVGYLLNLLIPGHLLVFTLVGYWFSNIAGILLMQFGLVDVWQGEPKERNLKRELLTGVASSTAYTLLIVALVQLHVLEMPNLFAENGSGLSALLPWLNG